MNERTVTIRSLWTGEVCREMANAIGYLSTWALQSESKCAAVIGIDKDGNVSALYKNKEGALTYEIFGMRD